MRGGVIRNLSTTHMLDRMAQLFGEEAIEVPVGFKHIIVGMQAHDALLGGESSGGLTIRGQRVHGLVGKLYMAEQSLPATPEMRAQLPRRLQEVSFDTLAGSRVQSVSRLDGTKLRLEGDQWVLLRFSGTEPLLRIVAESDTPAKARALIDQPLIDQLREQLGL